jgi:hypothetical protein
MDLIDLAILALRVALVVVLYAFLAYVVRGALRTLGAARPATEAARAPSQQAPAAVLRLVVLESGDSELHAGQVLVLDDGATLGRGDRASVVLTDPAVSAEHARLARADGKWVVIDLGSTNGTLVNQSLIDGQAALAPGDVLGLGNVRLKVVAH